MNLKLYPGKVIATEAQLAKFIFDRFGVGIYLVLMFGNGIRNFWYGEIFEDGFVRLKAKEKGWQVNEIDRMKRELNDLNIQVESEEDLDTKESMVNDIVQLKDDIAEEERDYKENKSKKKVGPSPYLKVSEPVYTKHAYQDYG